MCRVVDDSLVEKRLSAAHLSTHVFAVRVMFPGLIFSLVKLFRVIFPVEQ